MRKPLSAKIDEIVPSVTLGVASVTAELRAQGIKVYSFGAGEPDFKADDVLKKGAIDAINGDYSKYTDAKGFADVREAVSEKFMRDNGLNYPPEDIILSSGAKHSLFTALQALVSPGDEVIIPAPYWVSYSEMVKLAGGVPVIVKTSLDNGFMITADELKKAVTPRSKVFMLNNPVNPTGAVYGEAALLALGNICVENGLYILSDEIYEKFLYEGKKHISAAALSADIKNNTVTVNGISKTYAVPGWRLGYCGGPHDVIKAMGTVQGQCVSHPCTISQKACKAALEAEQGFVDDMLTEYTRRRELCLKMLGDITQISFIKPYGAFYFFVDISGLIGKNYRHTPITGSVDLCETLLKEKRVAMIPGAGFGKENFVRISYACSYDDIKAGLTLFGEFIEELKEN